MAGFLDTQSSANQVESLYVAYFGRAADGPGYLFWLSSLSSMEAAGTPAATAVVNIADSFAVQPEAKAAYSFLAFPPTTLSTTDPVQIAGVDAFINSVYGNLFHRAADSAGQTYWQTQILSGAVSIGSAVYAIANGALGSDQGVLADKIVAGESFTQQTFAANITSGNSFLAAAKDAVGPVVDATTLMASQAATTAFVAGVGNSALTLTPGQDTFSTSAAGAIFNAPLVTTTTQAGAFSFNVQTLTTNDSLTDSNGDGTLNATLNGNAVGAAIVSNVTMTGIKTANLTNVTGGGVSGFEGNITGLTIVNDNNSNAAIQLGAQGAGLNTALQTVSVTGYTGANGIATPLFTGLIAAKLGAAGNTISVALSGILGGTAFHGADSLQFSTDGSAGTKASPNLSYGTWGLTVNSNANLQLQQNGVGGATTLTLAGAGNVALGQDAAGNWQNLTKIDASASTGNVTITGAVAGNGTNAAGTAANPGGLYGSTSGLLTGNTALTSYLLSGGGGVNTLDVSSFTTTAQLAALTTTPGTNTSTANEIIVTSANADTILPTTWANIKGFQILGDVGAGGGVGDTGIINMANLPSTINDILYQTQATGPAGLVTINNAPAALTVDTEANGNGTPLAINASAAASDHVIVGSAALSAHGVVGNATMAGEQTVDFSAQGAAGNAVGLVTLTPASLSGSEAVTIDGSSSVTFGSASGAIVDLVFGVAPPTLNLNNLAITITDTGAVSFLGDTAGTGPLATHIAGDTSVVPVYSTNALTIDAHASGGLLMQGGDANFSTLTNNGDHLIGSLTSGNVLIGSIGNDVITGTSSATAADTIDTGGGADAITLGAGHTAADQIDLYAGSGGAGPGVATAAAPGSVVDATDHAQLGWWGIATNGAATVPVGAAAPPALFANGGGTSADMSTVANFTPGAGDSVNVSLSAFSGFLHDAGTAAGGVAAVGASSFSNLLALGGSVTTANADVLIFGTEFANAATLSTALKTAATAIHFGTPTTAPTEHFIVAYQDLSGNMRIGDLDLHSTAPVTSTAGGAGEVIAISDMVQLTGVTVAAMHNANIHFVA